MGETEKGKEGNEVKMLRGKEVRKDRTKEKRDIVGGVKGGETFRERRRQERKEVM